MKHILENSIKVAIALDNRYNGMHLDFVQFPQQWGSTALGFGGAGGDMMTTAITTVVFRPNDSCDVWFGDRWAYNIVKPNKLFYEDINKRRMKDVESINAYKNED